MDEKYIGDLLENWGLQQYLHLFIDNEFTKDSFSNLQYESLSDLFPKIGPRNLFWAKYKHHFFSNQDLLETTTLNNTSFDNYESLVSMTQPSASTMGNVLIMNLSSNGLESCLNSTNGMIIKQIYAKYGTLDNKNRNSLATLLVNSEFINAPNKAKFVITTARFREITAEIKMHFPNEPDFLYYIPYNAETRSTSKGKLWESYNYLKKKIRILKLDEAKSDYAEEDINVIAAQIQFLETHFEPIEDINAAWESTFNCRQKMLENPISTTSIEQYFSKFPVLKGEFGNSLILLDFRIKYKTFENKLFDNWDRISQKVIEIADAKNSPEIELAKQQKCPEILMLCILPFLLPYAYLKKTQNSKRLKLTKQEILENIFIHVKDGNLLHESIKIHMGNLKKYNLTFQPTVVFVGDTLDKVIASYVIINSILYKAENVLGAVDLCFKAFPVLNANYPEGSQVVWLFIQKVVYGINTKFDLDFLSLNTLINQISQ